MQATMSIGTKAENVTVVLPEDESSSPPNTPNTLSARERISWREFGKSAADDLLPSCTTDHCVLRSLFYLLVAGPSFLAILCSIIYLSTKIADAIMRPILLVSHVGNLRTVEPSAEGGTTKHQPSLFILLVLAQPTLCLMLLTTNKLKDWISASWSGLLLLVFCYCNCTMLFLDIFMSIVFCMDYLETDLSLLCAIAINLALPLWYYLLRLVFRILRSASKNTQNCTSSVSHRYDAKAPDIEESIGHVQN